MNSQLTSHNATSDNFFSCFTRSMPDERDTNLREARMGRLMKGSELSIGERLLLETLAGHIALLESAHPRKAKCAATRRAKQCVMAKLRHCGSRARLAA